MCKSRQAPNPAARIWNTDLLTAASARPRSRYAVHPVTAFALLVVCVLAIACSGAGPKLQRAGGDRAPSAPDYQAPAQADGAFAMPPKALAKKAPAVESPVSLTASDGSGLLLTHYSAKVVVEGPLAFTELSLSFHNPEPRTREGRFKIRLPQGAAISRFAMHGPRGWQEAEVVERKRAQLIYEDFLHQRVDPALMEKSAGNEFTARVFPISAGEDKQLVVSFSSELEDPKRFTLPLAGLPKVDVLRASVTVLRPEGPANVSRLDETDHQPTRDLVVDLPEREFGLTDGEHAVVRVAPQLDGFKATLPELTVLVDTSASRMLNLDADVQRLGQLCDALSERGHANMKLEVLAFDQGVQSIFSGALKDFGAAQRDRIRRRRALGASDLLGALEALRGKHRERVVLITDAVATAGETQSVVSKAGELGLDIGRIDVLLSGGLRDDTLAAAMARDLATGRGVVADLQQSAGELARKLTRATVDVRANVEGAAWYFPKSFDGMQPGDARLLYVAYPKAGPKPSKVDVEMTVSGKRQSRSYAVLPAQGPLLERAAASAKIGELSLMLQRGSAGAAERHRIVELSTSYRVLSDLTAMLVLESDADYQRYGLARNSLSDILVVGATGVELVQRTDLVYQPFEVVSPEPLRPGVRRDDKPAIAPQPVPLAEAKKEKKDASSTLTFPPTRNSARERRALNKPSAPEPQSPAQLDIQAAEETQSALEGGEWAEASEADGYGYEFEEDPLARASQGAGRAAQPAPPPPPPAAAPAPEPPPAAAAEDFEMPAPEPQSAPSDAVLRAESATAARQRVGRPGASSPDVAAAEVAIDEASEATVARADAWRTDGPAAHTGKYRDVIELTRSGQLGVAVERGFAWVDSEPGDALALLALGEALEGQGHLGSAARAYGSLIDLFPARSDLRRFAATRLERLGKAGLSLAVDSYDKAREQRPDHLTGYRLQAYALVRLGRYEEALSLLLEAVTKPSRIQRAALASEVLARDISLVAAAYAKAEPKRRAAIAQRIAPITKIASEPSTSFVLSWETDTNDVDLHVVDRDGDHAYYGNRRLRSGGELLEDVTRGYGPELFAIGGKLPAAPYELGVHYYSRGPMGYGMGRVEVIEHDGRGGLMLQTRPFVIMNDDARISLGTFTPTRP